MAFVITFTLPLHRSSPATQSRRNISPRMASVSRPSFSSAKHERIVPDGYDTVENISVPQAPEVAAVAATVCEFMNKERLRDLANYVVTFGNNFNDLSQLTNVKMTGLDAVGFTADVVSCDETSHCVCVQERFDWPLGLCHSASDIISSLKYLSAACGLPADF